MKRRRASVEISVIFGLLAVSVTLSVLPLNAAANRQADKFLSEAFEAHTLETIAYLYADDLGRQLDQTVITAPLNPFASNASYAWETIDSFLRFEEEKNSDEIKSFLSAAAADEQIRRELVGAASGAVLTLSAEPLETVADEDGIDMFPLILEINIKTKKINLTKKYKFILTAKFERSDQLKIRINRGGDYEPIYDGKLQIS